MSNSLNHAKRIKNIKLELDRLFADTAITASQTRQELELIQDYITAMVVMLPEAKTTKEQKR